ncbi:hypothetical protein [Gordonia zhaorongruii]|uniref:hypothetical protein n=1 Tax=Gordonia zhaorongruii TaxID=2597659 RepID=UPI001F23A9D8|nr:hypothetical protein [Gordonia zhaorongruii]
MKLSRTRTVLAAALAAAMVPAVAPSVARAAPIRTLPVLDFHIPSIGGIEAGPGGVAGGSFQQTHVTAWPSLRTMQLPAPPAAVTFRVENVKPWDLQYGYRFVSVAWRNLRNGRSGTVDLRHWKRPMYKPGTIGHDEAAQFPETLPTSRSVVTGGGPVVATVSVMRTQWQRPPMRINLVPGAAALLVPK